MGALAPQGRPFTQLQCFPGKFMVPKTGALLPGAIILEKVSDVDAEDLA